MGTQKEFGEWIEVLKDDGSSISPQIWIKVELVSSEMTDMGDVNNYGTATFGYRVWTSLNYNVIYDHATVINLAMPELKDSSQSGQFFAKDVKPLTSNAITSPLIDPNDTSKGVGWYADSGDWEVLTSVGTQTSLGVSVAVYEPNTGTDVTKYTGAYDFVVTLPFVAPTIGSGINISNISSRGCVANIASVISNGGDKISGTSFYVSEDPNVPENSSSTYSFWSSEATVSSVTIGNGSIGHTTDGGPNQSISLKPSTTYYVKGWIQNQAGWSNVATGSFTTLPEKPVLSNISIDSVTFGSFNASYSILDTGGSSIEVSRFELSTASDFSNITVINGVTAVISNLNPSTTYYIRGAVKNATTWGYTNEVSVTTSQFSNPSPPISLSLRVVTGGPDENGNLVEPIPTGKFNATWANAPYIQGSTEISSYEIQWLKKVSGGSYTAYGSSIVLPYTTLSNAITLNRSSFKPTDEIAFKIRSICTYKGVNYYSGWSSVISKTLVVERFVAVQLSNSSSFKYGRIYISKNGGVFTELEKNQTFKLL